ncbi:unnamed protein product [Didymodactylos carnosus]|uniref:Apolipoprotein D n=1 Tax=Didymodactylos carnosus TaxID=1234261 RepID=A0A814XYZ9_9BILA|nr:unnamed protein product [Didymodactylos carnosus]CAF1222450.1 unnamed protein product [Didymodactylos carnosus]CAF3767267.1 unnamed protein product [Didymodactylos carnosus]CAF3985718.1 unnamed protein product [Didymodactylos carnosus]
MNFAVLFACLIVGLFAAECPKFTTQNPFDAAQYGGFWYEFERSNIIFEIGSKCENATYNLNPNGTVGLLNQAINIWNQYVSYTGIATVKDPKEPAAFIVEFTTGDYNVITTNYKDYSLVYACEEVFGIKADFIWILSRKKTLPDSIVNELKTILKNFGIDISSLRPTVQDC